MKRISNDGSSISLSSLERHNITPVSFEDLLEKNEIPTNFMRVQVEANSLRKQWDDYLEGECKKTGVCSRSTERTMKRIKKNWA